METKNLAVYVILGYDINGVKDIPGLWIGEAEGKHYWMQIFDEIKARGRRCCLSAWMEYPGWKKGQEAFLRMWSSSGVSCIWSVTRSNTSPPGIIKHLPVI